jgi:P27 family predicted phage terminase small subunit
MPAGAPRKPTALKVVNGTARKGRDNPDEPKPEVCELACPDYLPEHAAAEWRRIVPELVILGLLSAVDRVALEGYCFNYHRWREAEEVIEEEGLTMCTPQGFEMQRPEVSIGNQARKQCLEFLREFGLSPASRGKVRATPKSPAEDAMERLKRKKLEREGKRRGA